MCNLICQKVNVHKPNGSSYAIWHIKKKLKLCRHEREVCGIGANLLAARRRVLAEHTIF
jgi:hypothetical protein